jgi:hypothetical protein
VLSTHDSSARNFANVVDRTLLSHAQSGPETDAAGQYWFTLEKPLERCREAMAACGNRILIACDVSKGGAKKFGSVRDPSALQEYVSRRRTLGLGHAHLYEGVCSVQCFTTELKGYMAI